MRFFSIQTKSSRLAAKHQCVCKRENLHTVLWDYSNVVADTLPLGPNLSECYRSSLRPYTSLRAPYLRICNCLIPKIEQRTTQLQNHKLQLNRSELVIDWIVTCWIVLWSCWCELRPIFHLRIDFCMSVRLIILKGSAALTTCQFIKVHYSANCHFWF